MLSEKEAKKIKEQIIKQIDSWQASEEQKEQAKKQIEEMPAEQLEEFLTKNKLIRTSEQPGLEKAVETAPEKCPFCLILQGKISAFKIDENKTALAVLEINPLSPGHSIIIPKKHQEIEKVSSQSFSLAKKTSNRLKSKLKPKEINIQTATAFGHGIINIIPVYENYKLERKKAEEDELKNLQEKLTSKPKTAEIIKEKKPKQLEKAPVRIP